MTTTETAVKPMATANGKVQTGSDAWERLRREFPANEIGKRPQPTVPAVEYRQLQKSKCSTCGGYHPAEKTIHLDFIGHARVTKRLNEVDPEWSWTWGADDPESGRPSKFLSLTSDQDGNVSLWMAMTVLGVTKREVGYAPPKAEQLKDAVSDAISRCAMRFGVGLDLWIKEPLAQEEAPQMGPSHYSDVPCPQPGCTGKLVQRDGTHGEFVSCTMYKSCGIKPIDGTLEDYQAREREMADARDAPELPDPSLPDADYIKATWKKVTSNIRLDAFGTGDLVRCLSQNSKKVWVLTDQAAEDLRSEPSDRVRAVADFFRAYLARQAAG